jgi:hypothetical protein
VTPTLGAMDRCRHHEREPRRIGYYDLVDRGTVVMTRRRQEGGYFTILDSSAGEDAGTPVVYRSRYVHVAVGYAGIQLLHDLRAYRAIAGYEAGS